MIVVTKNEFFNFIKSQPDDKKLNFKEFKKHADCGCPMIHYSREILRKNDLNVSANYWYESYVQDILSYKEYAHFEDGFSLASFMPHVTEDELPTTYGELKQYAHFEDGFSLASFMPHVTEDELPTTYGELKQYLSERYPEFKEKTMIVVTKNEFFNFIKSQSDDRELNFKEFKKHADCGCPMIHYSREIFKENDLNASGRDWYGKRGSYARFESGFHLSSFMPNELQLPTTYGELKQYLSEKYPEFNWEEYEKTMITVTKNEFFNFIKSQPDDKKLNFNEFKKHADCGCPMIHYSREILRKNDLSVSANYWYESYVQDILSYKEYAQFEDGFSLASFMPHVVEEELPTTYGELKQSLIERYPEFNWQN